MMARAVQKHTLVTRRQLQCATNMRGRPPLQVAQPQHIPLARRQGGQATLELFPELVREQRVLRLPLTLRERGRAAVGQDSRRVPPPLVAAAEPPGRPVTAPP